MYKPYSLNMIWEGIINGDDFPVEFPTNKELVAVIVQGLTRKQKVRIELDGGLSVPVDCNARDNAGVFFLGINGRDFQEIFLRIRHGDGRWCKVLMYRREV